MERPLRILHLEDNQNDIELVHADLTARGVVVDMEVVSTREGFVAALERGGVDLILSDFALPAFDGLSALRIAQREAPDIPFILVSGTIGEEAAIESLRSGATDYVLKHRLARLVPAVHRALSEDKERRARQRAEESLRESEERFRRVFEEGPVGMAMCGEGGEPFAVNDAFCRMFGRTREELIGAHPAELVHPEDLPAALEQIRKLFSGEIDGFQAERRYLRGNGEIAWGQVMASLVRFGAGRVRIGLVIVQDITERRRAEEALREGEERYRLLFESNPHPMWVYELHSLEFLAVNAAAVESYGYSREEFQGMTIKDIRPPGETAALMNDIAQTGPGLHHAGAWKHKRKDGSIIDVEIDSHDLVFLGKRCRLVLSTDVTDRKRLEEQFRQAQKMEAIGRLAGGVAHDFNNILGVIMGYGELVLGKLGRDDPQRDKVEQMTRAAERAASLTRQLLAFSRKQIVEPRVLDLNALLAEMDKMLRRLIGEDIELVTLEGQDLGRVNADAGQIEQIVMNLVVNARDAMEKGGRLTIETANVWLDEEYARSHPGVGPGPFVMIATSDTGTGMTPEVQARVFEPFFTTKEPGKGTGLGLATVYGIVKQSGGSIWIYSEPGRGTTFKVYLPRVDQPAEDVRLREVAAYPRGTETILVVEDEAAVRDLIHESLRAYGYHVLAAGSVDEAHKLAQDVGRPIHLLLTDVVLPGMNGQELANRLGQELPGLKALYMSGYTDDAIVHHGVLERGVAFLQKPFPLTKLAQKVREVLDSDHAGVA